MRGAWLSSCLLAKLGCTAWPMSALTRNERATDCAYAAGVGESRWSRNGMSDDSAPDVETEPISSWLKSAMQFTLPSSAVKLFEVAKVAMA